MPPTNKKIHGYNGPTGAYVAVDGKIKPLTEQTLTALVNATMKAAGH